MLFSGIQLRYFKHLHDSSSHRERATWIARETFFNVAVRGWCLPLQFVTQRSKTFACGCAARWSNGLNFLTETGPTFGLFVPGRLVP